MCHEESLYDRVLCVCNGLKWVKEKPRKEKTHCAQLERYVCGGHHLQRIVALGRVRTLILCRTCVGWASESRLAASKGRL